MKIKTHVVEVKETFVRYFRVEGKNAQGCVDRVKTLCENGAIDVTNLAEPTDGTKGSDFMRNVKQLWYLGEEKDDWYTNLHSLIPANADEDEIRALNGRKRDMTLSDKDIKTIKEMMEELRMYREEDEELREMDEDGLYEDEIALANKLGITLS